MHVYIGIDPDREIAMDEAGDRDRDLYLRERERERQREIEK